jgi:phage minor structural protein, N-terminal domain protein
LIYLTNGNTPLNAAYADEIVQIDSNTYQLTFRFPTSDSLWEKLKEETFLTADDLHGEQDFVIFEVEKKHGYIQVYANQVFTLLNNYVVNPISLDRATGSTALSRFAGAITRDNPFSFFSDIEDRHTFNIGSKNAMEAFAKDKHSIIGQWGGDLVRHGYQVRLLKKGGSENESLFMYKKNLSSYQHKTSTKSLKTRIIFKTTVKGEGEKAPDRKFSVVVDSPLINKYSQIYEDVIEVNDQDVKDEVSLRKYGEQYYRTSLCDMMEDSLEIEVVGQSDVPVQMYDIVSLFHDVYNLDVRKKITKYTYSPMAKKLKSIGFGQFQSGLANAIGNAVSDAVKGEAQQFQDDFERQLARELKNADLAFDRKTEELKNEFEDGLNATRAKAEEVKRELSDTINQRFNSFDISGISEAKRRAEEALRNAGASTLLAQEAKRIGLDFIAKLEAFKSQATSAQKALSGDLDTLKRAIANDIRPKQEQVTTEIAKQVEALVQTKKELAGVKSAQATYEETTTRRLSELTNLANGKASKSELVQTAEELTSKIASVQVAQKNQGDRVSTVESNFRQRADALDAGVSRLTEGLRTKADISSLNVTAENIRQSVKSLETNTQNKLDQKLSMAEFEVQAGSIRQEILNATKDKADKTLVTAEAGKLREEFSSLRVGGTNLLKGSKGPFLPDRKPANFDNNVLYTGQTSIYMEQGQEYIISAKTNGNFTAHHDGNKESDNVVLWIMDKDVRNYQIVSDLKTGTTGTKIIWNKPTGIYHLRVNTYHKNAVKSVWDVKVEKGTLATDWSPAPEDTDGLITEAKATFERTAQGLRTDLSAIQEYVNKDGQRQEALQRYTREESAKQAMAVRELVARDFVGKASYQEDVRGIERKFEGITNPQNGSIATQIAKYKNAVDGRFTEITSMISGKVNQTDFQRVQETSKLYERIIGNNENDISNKVARMALTNQLFQVEVSKYSGNGANRALNTTSDWGPFISRSGGNGVNLHADLHKILSSGFKAGDTVHVRMEISIDDVQRFNDKQIVAILQSYGDVTNWTRTGRTFDYNIGTLQPGNNWRLIEFNTVMTEAMLINNSWMLNLRVDGAKSYKVHTKILKIEKGNIASAWSPAPEDTEEAVRSVQSQLAGSWSVQNINSAGDLISGLNLGANGHNRLSGKLTHITGETLIERAVIKSAMIDKLKTANFEAGSVTTIVLDAEAVTAEKIKVDQALFNKLVANEAYLSQLFAKQAFINRVQSVAIDASQVRSGILSGDRIYGGTIRGANIFGGTLTGHTKIQLGSYGSFDTVNGGLQINVPRDYNSKDGLGVQFIGSYGRGENVPYGLFIYKDSDFTTGGYASRSDDFLLTVEGYIKANGIGWFKTGKGSIDGSSTATIGYWNSSVSMDFGGSGNDIYYSYNGKAYSLWTIVNQHFSDRRLKENIVDCKHKALDYIQQFQFKEYDWKKQEDRPQQAHTKIGLIAQEVQAVDPTLVYENGDTLNLDNLRLTNIALKAIQELALENKTLTHRLENLENERRTA